MVVVHSIESDDDQKEISNNHTMEINIDKTKARYPKDVQKILTEYVGFSLCIYQ